MRPDWTEVLAEHEPEQVKDDAFKRFVRGRLIWYGIAVVAISTVYFAM